MAYTTPPDFTPFDILTAAQLDILSNNDISFNNGTGIFGLYKNLLAVDSNPYKFRARRTAALNSSAGNAILLPYDAEDFDTNNNLDITTNKGRYTAPVAGFYWFNAYVNMAATSNVLSLYKNGSVYQRGAQTGSGGTVSSWFVQSGANDYWEIYFFGANTVAVDVTATLQPFFEGFLISRT